MLKINSAYLVRHFFCLFYLYVISCTFITFKIACFIPCFITYFIPFFASKNSLKNFF